MLITFSLIGEPSTNPDKRQNYKGLYVEIIDNIKGMLTERFAGCEHFAFLDFAF